MDSLREYVASLYLALVYAGGPLYMARANESLLASADNSDVSPEAARLLRATVEETGHLFDGVPTYTWLVDLRDRCSRQSAPNISE